MSLSIADPFYPKAHSLCCFSAGVGVHGSAASAGACTTPQLEGIVSEWWQAWPLTREGSGGPTYRNILLPCCKELIKVAMDYSSKRWMELDVHVLHCPGMLFFVWDVAVLKYLSKCLRGKEKCLVHSLISGF